MRSGRERRVSASRDRVGFNPRQRGRWRGPCLLRASENFASMLNTQSCGGSARNQKACARMLPYITGTGGGAGQGSLRILCVFAGSRPAHPGGWVGGGGGGGGGGALCSCSLAAR